MTDSPSTLFQNLSVFGEASAVINQSPRSWAESEVEGPNRPTVALALSLSSHVADVHKQIMTY